MRRNNEIPVVCAADKCDAKLTLRDFKNLAIRTERLVDSAMRTFIQANSMMYGYCFTPNCPMVYRKWDARGSRRREERRKVERREDVEFICSACSASLCTKCLVLT